MRGADDGAAANNRDRAGGARASARPGSDQSSRGSVSSRVRGWGSGRVCRSSKTEDRLHPRPPFARRRRPGAAAGIDRISASHSTTRGMEAAWAAKHRRKSGPVGFHHHHQPAAEEIDIHLEDAGAAQAGEHLGPDAPVMRPVGLDAASSSLRSTGEHAARYRRHAFGVRLFHSSTRESKLVPPLCVYFSVKVSFSSLYGTGVGWRPSVYTTGGDEGRG